MLHQPRTGGPRLDGAGEADFSGRVSCDVAMSYPEASGARGVGEQEEIGTVDSRSSGIRQGHHQNDRIREMDMLKQRATTIHHLKVDGAAVCGRYQSSMAQRSSLMRPLSERRLSS
jgi:hypothetical protein